MERENQWLQQELQPEQSPTSENVILHAELLRYHSESRPVTARQKTHHAQIEKLINGSAIVLSLPAYTTTKAFHEAFEKLQQHFPQLSKTETEVAAMLAHGFTNKCIAQLRNTTIRAVEICRTRMRANMQLKRGEDLVKKIKEVVW